ncbi:MAG: hypothetical protein HZA50_01225 [Planctomycetes bacterium]|nr:hypothetical protein [Planctomycetota bacterium]
MHYDDLVRDCWRVCVLWIAWCYPNEQQYPTVRRWLIGPEGNSEKVFKAIYEIGQQDPDPANAALAEKKLKSLPAN